MYYGTHIDTRPKRRNYDSVAVTTPDYALGPHTASLGLTWSPENAASLPQALRHGMFVGQHGSWNRKPRSGYKVIFVPFEGGLPSGPPVDVLSGFVRDNGDAMGRPVGVAIDGRGALLVADDVGNAVWRVRQ
jgi:glucose/arabinose dehydrogenase